MLRALHCRKASLYLWPKLLLSDDWRYCPGTAPILPRYCDNVFKAVQFGAYLLKSAISLAISRYRTIFEPYLNAFEKQLKTGNAAAVSTHNIKLAPR